MSLKLLDKGRCFVKIRTFGLMLLTVANIGLAPLPSQADSLSGPYLAAQRAFAAGDFEQAAEYYQRVLAIDPENIGMADSAMSSLVALGDFEAALPFAQLLTSQGNVSQIANMVVMLDHIKADRWAKVQSDLEAGLAVSDMIDGAVQAWGALAQGNVGDAIEGFDAIIATEGLTAFGSYQKALALAYVGDFEGAEDLFGDPANTSMLRNTRALIAQGQVLGQLGRTDDAIALLSRADPLSSDTAIQSLLARLTAGETVPFDGITNPKEGLAEVFLTVAVAIQDEAPEAYTLAYSWAAHELAPTRSDAILTTAELYDALGRYDLSSATFAMISPEDPAFLDAEIGRAAVLEADGRNDAAIEVLQQLARTYPESGYVAATLGDSLRRVEDYKQADSVYTTALDLYGDDASSAWFIYFARGISRERLNRWDDAESDFRAALELRPGHPSVLNYLGYSLVDRGEKLDEALSLIEQAVAAQPNNGAIIDSLGWALFKLGRFEEAVPVLERGSELEATDPVVNDHLGDALWVVGRKLEAQFQWQRALSFDPEEDEATRIRRKIEIGLDAVMIEEGKDPFSVARGDN